MKGRTIALVSIALMFTSSPSIAGEQEDLIAKGSEQVERGDHDEAFRSFLAAYKLGPTPEIAGALVQTYPLTKDASASESVRKLELWSSAVKLAPASCTADAVGFLLTKGLLSIVWKVETLETDLAEKTRLLNVRELEVRTTVAKLNSLQESYRSLEADLSRLEASRDQLLLKNVELKKQFETLRKTPGTDGISPQPDR